MMKISKLQIGKFITQIVFLICFPGLFTLTFSELKQIYTMALSGNFNFISALPGLIEVIVLIPLTIIFGRFFCGWMCAFGTFNDILYAISKRAFKIKFKVSKELDSILKYLKFVILAFIIAAIWTTGASIFEGSSPWDAFAQLTDPLEAVKTYTIGSIILALIIIGALFIERFFCRYLCPLGAIFAISSKIRIFDISKPRDKCGSCRICTNNCAMGISLYEVDRVKSGECINCLKCVSVCPRKNTQAAIVGENINPAMGSAVAIAAFAGAYSLGSVLTNGAESPLTNGAVVRNNLLSSSQNVTYKDGTYTGIGNGYRPGLEVEVTVKNNKITDIKIGSNNETPRYASRPFNTIPQEIIAAQSTDVDTISGATRTSRGIIMAVEDALNDAKVANSTVSNSTSNSNSSAANGNSTNNNAPSRENRNSGYSIPSSKGTFNGSTSSDNKRASSNSSSDKNSSSSSSSSSSSNSSTSSNVQSTYKDGTYTGTGRGYRPGLQVSVTIKSNKITDIQIGSNNETPRYASRPFNTIPQEIIAAQSTKVDTVSGATRTSNGIIMAVEEALSQAKK